MGLTTLLSCCCWVHIVIRNFYMFTLNGKLRLISFGWYDRIFHCVYELDYVIEAITKRNYILLLFVSQSCFDFVTHIDVDIYVGEKIVSAPVVYYGKLRTQTNLFNGRCLRQRLVQIIFLNFSFPSLHFFLITATNPKSPHILSMLNDK